MDCGASRHTGGWTVSADRSVRGSTDWARWAGEDGRSCDGSAVAPKVRKNTSPGLGREAGLPWVYPLNDEAPQRGRQERVQLQPMRRGFDCNESYIWV